MANWNLFIDTISRLLHLEASRDENKIIRKTSKSDLFDGFYLQFKCKWNWFRNFYAFSCFSSVLFLFCFVCLYFFVGIVRLLFWIPSWYREIITQRLNSEMCQVNRIYCVALNCSCGIHKFISISLPLKSAQVGDPRKDTELCYLHITPQVSDHL